MPLAGAGAGQRRSAVDADGRSKMVSGGRHGRLFRAPRSSVELPASGQVLRPDKSTADTRELPLDRTPGQSERRISLASRVFAVEFSNNVGAAVRSVARRSRSHPAVSDDQWPMPLNLILA